MADLPDREIKRCNQADFLETKSGVFMSWNQAKKRLLNLAKWLLACFVLLPATTYGYDFSDVRNSLVKDLAKWQGHASRNKISIVYNNEHRERIKQNYNLVTLKRDLSHELLKSFDIADPIIVEEILKSNQLHYQQIADNKSLLGQFADRANSVHVLLVDFQPKPNTLVAHIKLVNRDYATISTIITEILPDTEGNVSYPSSETVRQPSTSNESIFPSFKFSSRKFTAGQNDAWIYFSPTALLIPQSNAVHASLWFKDISEVDIQVVRFYYDLKVLELLQFGIQSYGIVEKVNSQADEPNTESEVGHHSTYLSLKYFMVSDSILPVNISLGIRRRLLFDPNNTDFRSRDRVDKSKYPEKYKDAKELDENNDRYNALTLQAMITGKFEDIGILYNIYVDSQTIGTGIKFVLTPDIKLFADNVYYYFEDPDILTDTAAGIQLYNSYGSTDVMYQFETQQIQLGLNINF